MCLLANYISSFETFVHVHNVFVYYCVSAFLIFKGTLFINDIIDLFIQYLKFIPDLRFLFLF